MFVDNEDNITGIKICLLSDILTTRFSVHIIYIRILKLSLDFSSNAIAQELNKKIGGTDLRYFVLGGV
jgi:hypothetical protein